jgi:hypothetical protein
MLAERGRGLQMHVGACAANGDVLWFLHADTQVSPESLDKLLAAIADPTVAGGNFELLFDGGTRPARFLTWIYPHFRKIGLCYGDSGIFVRRNVYEALGGFRPYPIFEDLDMVWRIRRIGRFVHVPCRLTTSSRRFEGKNFTLVFLRWVAMQMLFWLGVSPHRLDRFYAPVRERQRRMGCP